MRNTARLAWFVGLVLTATAWAAPAKAVTFEEQARRLQLIYAYLLDFRPLQGPLLSRRTRFELGLELTPAPSIDNRVGGKDEPVTPPAFIPRPRGRFHSPSGMVLGAAYTPPVEVSGYQASLIALEAGFRFPLGNWRAGLRAYAMDGEVEGPVTEADMQDDFQLTNVGADALFGLQIGFWLPYVGAGRSKTESTLTIQSDGVMLEARRSYSYLLAGLSVDVDNLRFTLEQSRTDSVLDHFTLSASWVF